MSALTLAPVSAKAAELLHALYAEAMATAVASAQLPSPGAIVLREPPTSLKATYREHGGYRHVTLCSKGHEYEISLHTPMLGDPERSWRRPGIWLAAEEREDMHGRTWRSSLPGLFTTDDFGDLVEVPE